METVNSWYYVKNGEQIGPLDSNKMEELIANGEIKRETKVWQGEGDWVPAQDTDLNKLFYLENSPPPPLKGNDVNNTYVWLMVAVPIIGFFVEAVLERELIPFYIICYIGLCILDEKKLKKSGNAAPASWLAIFVPVYLWKRATLLNQKKNYFIAWCATFVLAIFLNVVLGNSVLEENACPLVTQILKEQTALDFFTEGDLHSAPACKSVTIDKEVTDGFYKATATLDNGNDIAITIDTKKEKGKIYVQITGSEMLRSRF